MDGTLSWYPLFHPDANPQELAQLQKQDKQPKKQHVANPHPNIMHHRSTQDLHSSGASAAAGKQKLIYSRVGKLLFSEIA